MNREHGDTQLGSRLDGSGHGVRDVVEFQVEEDFAPGVDQLRNDLWPLSGEELKTDLVEGNRVAELIDDLLRIDGGRHVQGDDQAVFWGGHAGILARKSVPSAVTDGSRSQCRHTRPATAEVLSHLGIIEGS